MRSVLPGRTLWSMCLCVWLAQPNLNARVFKTIPGAPATRPAEALYWELGHHTRMEINGVPAEVRVWHSRENPSVVLQRLTDHYSHMGKKTAPLSGSDLGWLEAEDEGLILRYLVMGGQGNDSLITQIVRHKESAREKNAPTRHLLEDLPLPPAAEPVSCLKDVDAGTTTETSRIMSGSPESVRDYMVNGLTADGWATPAPTASDTGIWLKGKEIASFTITEDTQGQLILVRVHRKRQ